MSAKKGDRIGKGISKGTAMVRFLLLVIGLAGGLYLLVFYLGWTHFVLPVQNFVAKNIALVLNLVGLSASVEGPRIVERGLSLDPSVCLDGFRIVIVYECTGLFAVIIYSSLVLAYPSSWRRKGLGIVFGLTGIHVINVVRLTFMVWLGVYHQGLFDFFHKYLWQVTFVICWLMLWVFWINRIAEREKPVAVRS